MKRSPLIFILSIVLLINSNLYSQVKESKKHYKVLKSDYTLYEDGKIYPVYDYSAFGDYDWYGTLNPFPEQINSEKYVISVSNIDSVETGTIRSPFAFETGTKFNFFIDDKLFGEYLQKTDTSIVLKINNGNNKSLFAPNFLTSMSAMMAFLNDYNLENRCHQFQGYLKNIDAYLIYWAIPEVGYSLEDGYFREQGYSLISKKDGSEISWNTNYYYEGSVQEYPIFSKDKKKAILFSSTGIRLYSLTETGFTEEFNASYFENELETTRENVTVLKWNDDHSVTIKLDTYDENTGESVELYKLISFHKK